MTDHPVVDVLAQQTEADRLDQLEAVRARLFRQPPTATTPDQQPDRLHTLARLFHSTERP